MSPRQPSDPVRRLAADVVHAVDVDDAYSNLLLPRVLRERGLSGRDAAFATELTYGTLRWQGSLDAVLAAAARRPVDAIDPKPRTVLRLGAYQLLRMRTPSHAAVHESVQLARTWAGERVVGFVNAVLRRVAQGSWETWVERVGPPDPAARAVFAAGYPLWIAAAFASALGDDPEELAAVLAADRPSTHLVARPGRITRDELLTQAGPDASPGPWSPYAVRLAGGDPASLPAVRAGAAGVQDEGSQLVALALARAELGGQDRRWLDVCAGPGGKAALLAAVGGPAVTLSAAELAPHRALLVRNALRGDGQVLVADGTRPAWQPGAFDRVLVDAPCTGLGALRRRPEVRWRRQENDVGRLHELQTRLLLSACDSVRPGGLVAYVTCSPHPAETRAVVAAVQRQRPVERVDAVAACELPRSDQSGPDVQLWPHRHGTDAMYLALLRRADGGG